MISILQSRCPHISPLRSHQLRNPIGYNSPKVTIIHSLYSYLYIIVYHVYIPYYIPYLYHYCAKPGPLVHGGGCFLRGRRQGRQGVAFQRLYQLDGGGGSYSALGGFMVGSAIHPLVNHHFHSFSLFKDIKSTICLGDISSIFRQTGCWFFHKNLSDLNM